MTCWPYLMRGIHDFSHSFEMTIGVNYYGNIYITCIQAFANRKNQTAGSASRVRKAAGIMKWWGSTENGPDEETG